MTFATWLDRAASTGRAFLPLHGADCFVHVVYESYSSLVCATARPEAETTDFFTDDRGEVPACPRGLVNQLQRQCWEPGVACLLAYMAFRYT